VQVGELLSRATNIRLDVSTKIATWLESLSARDRNFVVKVIRDCCEHLRQKSA